MSKHIHIQGDETDDDQVRDPRSMMRHHLKARKKSTRQMMTLKL